MWPSDASILIKITATSNCHNPKGENAYDSTSRQGAVSRQVTRDAGRARRDEWLQTSGLNVAGR